MMNMKKAKAIVFSRNEIDRKLEVINQKIESEEEFVCLGSLITCGQ